MSWWRRALRREPRPPHGRHHAGATRVEPVELAARLNGMIDAYVPAADTPVPLDRVPDAPPPVDVEPADVPGRLEAVPPSPAASGDGVVVLGFADGSSEVLAADDARTRPFRALVRELLRGAA